VSAPAGVATLEVTPTLVAEHGLSPTEYERILEILGREPTFPELGVFSAMWSEHCGYKSSKPLLRALPTEGACVVQGPGENAGVIDAGDGWGLAFKIESHNHPSAVEPYQGAATGSGGILRDIFTMGARPIAILDSLHFGSLDSPRSRYLLDGVVRGVGDYGNCVGVPTVGGEAIFDPRLVEALLAAPDTLLWASLAGAGSPDDRSGHASRPWRGVVRCHCRRGSSDVGVGRKRRQWLLLGHPGVRGGDPPSTVARSLPGPGGLRHLLRQRIRPERTAAQLRQPGPVRSPHIAISRSGRYPGGKGPAA
jgi:hypothetical protein